MSHITPEAEIIAADLGVREVAYPLLDLGEHIGGVKNMKLELLDDSTGFLTIIRTGEFQKVAHVLRTHGVSSRKICSEVH